MATRNEIIAAAETLLAEGKRPTLAAVRAAVGGGSFTTISEALKAWKADQAKSEARAEVVDVPESVKQAMSQAAVTVWTEAQQHHAAQLAADREALEVERQRIEAERQEAIELADQVSRDLDASQAKALQLAADLEISGQVLTDSRASTAEAQAQATERATRIEALTAELEQAQEQAQAAALNSAARESRLTSELEQAQEQADASAGLLAEVEKRATAETLRADRAESTADQAKDHAADLEQEITQLRTEAKTVGQELADAKAEAGSAARLITSAEARADAAEVRERTASTEAAKLAGKLEVLAQAKPEKTQNRTPRGRS